MVAPPAPEWHNVPDLSVDLPAEGIPMQPGRGTVFTMFGALLCATGLITAAEPAPAVGPATEQRFPPLVLPDGFRATLFACDPLVEYPSVIALGPRPGTLLVALGGVVVNLLATRELARANRDSLNVEGAFQHVLTDLVAFVATAVAGALILLGGWARADGVAALFVAAIMIRAAVGLLRDSGRILLESAPEGIAVDEVGRAIALTLVIAVGIAAMVAVVGISARYSM